MATVCAFIRLSLLLFAAFPQASDSSLSKARRAQSAAGVFLLIEGDKYTFNFTAATAACQSLNVTMATGAQMVQAVQRGLETCKFGWTSEQVAVVPRLTSDSRCGSGKTGVVTWNAEPNTKFGAFCFNASEEAPDRSTTSTTVTPTPTPAPATPPPERTTAPPPTTPTTTTTTTTITTTATKTTKGPEQTSAPPLPSTPPSRVSSSSSSSSSSTTRVPTSHPPPLLTSSPTSTPPTSVPPSVSHESVGPSSVTSTTPALGDVPTALIILSIILLLLTAAGLVWYYKLNIFTSWSHAQQQDDTETEMWKHTDSEMNLHIDEGEDEDDDDDDDEDSHRKYSSDITLCVNPQIKMDPLK